MAENPIKLLFQVIFLIFKPWMSHNTWGIRRTRSSLVSGSSKTFTSTLLRISINLSQELRDCQDGENTRIRYSTNVHSLLSVELQMSHNRFHIAKADHGRIHPPPECIDFSLIFRLQVLRNKWNLKSINQSCSLFAKWALTPIPFQGFESLTKAGTLSA